MWAIFISTKIHLALLRISPKESCWCHTPDTEIPHHSSHLPALSPYVNLTCSGLSDLTCALGLLARLLDSYLQPCPSPTVKVFSWLLLVLFLWVSSQAQDLGIWEFKHLPNCFASFDYVFVFYIPSLPVPLTVCLSLEPLPVSWLPPLFADLDSVWPLQFLTWTIIWLL